MGTSFRGLVWLIALCGLSAVSVAQGSAGPAGLCTVTRLRLRIATSDDDLRGGQDNLNIVVFFANARPHVALNVNKSANWPNNSVNTVDIFLNPPIPPSEIRALRFIHIADGGVNTGDLLTALTPAGPIKVPQAFQSPDNWNMADVAVAAIGNGVGARIASYGYHRFTGSDPVLTIPVRIPANICGSGRPTRNSGSGSNSGGGSGAGSNSTSAQGSVQSISGNSGQGQVGSASGALTNQDVARMAKAGVPESAIIASIQTRSATFDISPEGLIALKRAGASQNVLQAMLSHDHGELVPAVQVNGDGRSADELNPQPYPRKSRANVAGAVKPSEPSAQPVPNKVTLLRGEQTMLATQTASASSGGSKSALVPAVNQPAITDGTKQSAATVSEAGHSSTGDTGVSKFTGKAKYDPITADRGVTTSNEFNQWAGTTNPKASKASAPSQGPTLPPSVTSGGTAILKGGNNSGNGRSVQTAQAILPVRPPSNGRVATAVQPITGTALGANAAQLLPPTALNSGYVGAACSQDPTPRILGVTGAGEPITFRPGRRYVIWGCSFGPANPNNAVYLSDGGSFQWFLSKSSWTSNAISVSFSVAPSGVQGFQKTYGGTQLGNLMLLVSGQNGNTKVNGVTLSVQ